MTRFLKELTEKLGAVVLEGHEPNNEMAEGETVVGTMSDELKQLYAIFDDSAEEVKKRQDTEKEKLGEITKKPMSECSTEELAFVQNFLLAIDRHEKLGDIFWHEVAEEFPQTTTDDLGVGVRKGWQVVVLAPEKKRSPLSSCGIIIVGSIPFNLGL